MAFLFLPVVDVHRNDAETAAAVEVHVFFFVDVVKEFSGDLRGPSADVFVFRGEVTKQRFDADILGKPVASPRWIATRETPASARRSGRPASRN
ncbi:MAG: hypothetical protein M5R36_22850 [Deltaproteobacteria bacterium]|nr:hypothetical protein [Deltaproteobacteria bacterium]